MEGAMASLITGHELQSWTQFSWNQFSSLQASKNSFMPPPISSNATDCGNWKRSGTKISSLNPFLPLESAQAIDWGNMNLEKCVFALRHLADSPSMDTYLCILQKCRQRKSLGNAMIVHSHLCSHGADTHVILENHLVSLFVECKSIHHAQFAFNRLMQRSEFVWTSLVQGYVDSGQPRHALDLAKQMREDGVALTKFTFVALFKACARLQLLDTGQDLHEELADSDSDLVSDLYVGSILVDMYAKCGSIEKAQEVFDGLSSRSIVSWSALMSGYAELGPREKVLKCLDLMVLEGVSPDTGCYICGLKVCGDLNDIHKGHELHTKVIIKGLEDDLILNHILMDMYAKCCSLEETQAVFNRLEIKNVVAWTTLIARYVDHGFIEQALGCLDQMQAAGVCPDDITLVCGLRACRDLGAIEKGRDIHTFLVREELEKIPYVCNTLIDFYVKQGSMEEAYNLFEELSSHDLILWTTLILGYVENKCAKEAIRCFEQMQGEGLTPDTVVYNAVISASATEFKSETAVRLYLQMQERGILPDNTTIIGVLEACKNKSALEFGTVIHAQFLGPFGENETDTQLATIILDMYAKCGNMVAAQDVFDSMTFKDTVAWTALISGYAGQGESKMIFGLLKTMMEEGISMDGEAFLSVLIACAHAGLVNEGQMIFESMGKDHSITPTVEHVNCLVDLLGRVGRLNEAALILRHSSISPDPVMWVTVLGACRKWHNIEVARNVFDHATALDGNNKALYSLMSNIYADAGLWEEVRLIEAIRARQG